MIQFLYTEIFNLPKWKIFSSFKNGGNSTCSILEQLYAFTLTDPCVSLNRNYIIYVHVLKKKNINKIIVEIVRINFYYSGNTYNSDLIIGDFADVLSILLLATIIPAFLWDPLASLHCVKDLLNSIIISEAQFWIRHLSGNLGCATIYSGTLVLLVEMYCRSLSCDSPKFNSELTRPI